MSTLEEKTFDIKNLQSKDPFKQFNVWYEEACKSHGVKRPDAVCLATASSDGKPSCRMMSVRGCSDKGFTFFTKYDSKKGHDLDVNPYASLCFYWEGLERQVIATGRVEKISRSESEKHFAERRFEVQVTSRISQQDKPLENKQELFDKYYEESKRLENAKEVPTPENWGGFILIAEEVEFWQSNVNHLDDRIRFFKSTETAQEGVEHGANEWLIERLCP